MLSSPRLAFLDSAQSSQAGNEDPHLSVLVFSPLCTPDAQGEALLARREFEPRSCRQTGPAPYSNKCLRKASIASLLCPSRCIIQAFSTGAPSSSCAWATTCFAASSSFALSKIAKASWTPCSPPAERAEVSALKVSFAQATQRSPELARPDLSRSQAPHRSVSRPTTFDRPTTAFELLYPPLPPLHPLQAKLRRARVRRS